MQEVSLVAKVPSARWRTKYLLREMAYCCQVMAHEENQKYKEGKFILERAKMMDLYEGNFTSASEASTVILGNDMEEVCS